MDTGIVRIKSVEIHDFKNINYGRVCLANAADKSKPSVLGLYGQNGSGKTGFIDAIDILRLALSGKSLPKAYSDFINVDAQKAVFVFELYVQRGDPAGIYSVRYQFSIRQAEDISEQNIEQGTGVDHSYRTEIFDEVLSYSYHDEYEDHILSPIVDTRDGDIFVPQTKYNELVGKDKELAAELRLAKKLALAKSKSLAFSREMIRAVRDNCKTEYHRFLFNRLARFGNLELFVINSESTGLISINALPIAFRLRNNHRVDYGNMMINLNEPSIIPEEAMDVVKGIIESMNIVLTSIIPGLNIKVIDFGAQLLNDGETGRRVELVSSRGTKDIPLRNESDGIKKIISVLQLLIVFYNEKSMTIAIDELDAGIFEYLLGELMRILTEKGKGQLLFTSHNLRPLETIDRSYIAFTTVNPKNRYIKLNNVKNNNNIRSFYFRDIVLGEQHECVYERTNNAEIALAFKEAGEQKWQTEK